MFHKERIFQLTAFLLYCIHMEIIYSLDDMVFDAKDLEALKRKVVQHFTENGATPPNCK